MALPRLIFSVLGGEYIWPALIGGFRRLPADLTLYHVYESALEAEAKAKPN